MSVSVYAQQSGGVTYVWCALPAAEGHKLLQKWSVNAVLMCLLAARWHGKPRDAFNFLPRIVFPVALAGSPFFLEG